MRNIKIAIKPISLLVTLAFAGGACAVGTGSIVSGSGSISKNSNNTIVNQNSDKMIINWDNMNVAKNESLNFKQNGVNSAVLNKITSIDPTLIQGALNANGKVFIVNPNGVLIGNGAKINVGSLIASSLDIKNDDFNKGNYHFSGAGKGKVVNEGEINSANSTALLGGGEVTNTGRITANQGDVNLAAGSDIMLSFPAMGKMSVRINQGSLKALVNNGGIVVSKDGSVMLTAWATDKLTRGVINNTGMLEASDMRFNGDGSVYLSSKGNGIVNAGGKISTTGLGSINASAQAINVNDGAEFKTLTNTSLTSVAKDGYVSVGKVNVKSGNTTIVADNVLTTAGARDAHFGDKVSTYTLSNKNDIDLANTTVTDHSKIQSGKSAISAGFVDAVAKSGQELEVFSTEGNINVNNGSQNYGDMTLSSSRGNINVNSKMNGKSVSMFAKGVNQKAGAAIHASGPVNIDSQDGFQQNADIVSAGAVDIATHGKITQKAGVSTIADKELTYTAQNAQLDGATRGDKVNIKVEKNTVQAKTGSLNASRAQLHGGNFNLSQGNNSVDSVMVSKAGTLNLSTAGNTTLEYGSKINNDLTLNSNGNVTLNDLAVRGNTRINAQDNVTLAGVLNGNKGVTISAKNIDSKAGRDNYFAPGIRSGENVALNTRQDVAVESINAGGDVNVTSGGSVTTGIKARNAAIKAGGNVALLSSDLSQDINVTAQKDVIFKDALSAGRDVTIAANNIGDATPSRLGKHTIESGRHTTLTASQTIAVNDIKAGKFNDYTPDRQKSQLRLNGKNIDVERYAAGYEVVKNGQVIGHSASATGTGNYGSYDPQKPTDPVKPGKPGGSGEPTDPIVNPGENAGQKPTTPGFPFDNEPMSSEQLGNWLLNPQHLQWLQTSAGMAWLSRAQMMGRF